MENIYNLFIQEKEINEEINEEIYFKLCEEFGFIKGKKTVINGITGIIKDLTNCLYMFENRNGNVFYISNVYMQEEEIEKNIKSLKIKESVKIIGPGFVYPETIMIMLNYKVINSFKKKDENYSKIQDNEYTKAIKKYKGQLAYEGVAWMWLERFTGDCKRLIEKWNSPRDVYYRDNVYWKTALNDFMVEKRYIEGFVLSMVDEKFSDIRNVILTIYGVNSREAKSYSELMLVYKNLSNVKNFKTGKYK